MMTQLKTYVLVIALTLLLMGCETIPDYKAVSVGSQTVEQRQQQLSTLNHWRVIGKIAFIQGRDRESANLSWQKNANEQTQRLSLTATLGINVLKLTSENALHTLEVDGKTHTSDNLDQLIYSLTGLELPAIALSHWIKATSYLPSDNLVYDSKTNLPSSLSSNYMGNNWRLYYSHYVLVDGVVLPTRLSIKQQSLIIKIQINQWALYDLS